MKLSITDDCQFMICSSDFPYELQLLKKHLTREVENSWLIKKHRPWETTERCFINEYGLVPTGLWLNIIQFSKEYNVFLETDDKMQRYLNQFTLDESQFKMYVNHVFDGAVDVEHDNRPLVPRQYQIEAAYKLLTFKKSCGEISTSAGKTLISFIIFKYLVDMATRMGKKILYIVPSVDLATQSAKKYEVYEAGLKNKSQLPWSIGILKSPMTKKEKAAVEKCNILFGTYQSLRNKDSNFFADFIGCITDEMHHAKSNSIKGILSKCYNLQYSIGITGTFAKKSEISYLESQAYIGPLVYTLTADDLINKEKSATPIYVVAQIMDWASEEEKQALYLQRCQKANNPDDMTLGTKLLKQEMNFINGSYTRLRYIGNMGIKMAKNTLILFGDVKGEYGKKIAEYIKDNSQKNVYYIDGNTPSDNREYYKQCCAADKNGNTVIVGSIYTMGEGIDVPNIESIFLVNTAKSDRIIRQICGRGLRMSEGKEKCILYDFVDDLRYSDDSKKKYQDNYMVKHYNERKKIYKEQNFPLYE